jgi:hypothetical protein
MAAEVLEDKGGVSEENQISLGEVALSQVDLTLISDRKVSRKMRLLAGEARQTS